MGDARPRRQCAWRQAARAVGARRTAAPRARAFWRRRRRWWRNEPARIGAAVEMGDSRRRPDLGAGFDVRSEEHTSELQSLMRISYAVFCLNKKTLSQRRSIEYSTEPLSIKHH